MDLFVSCIVLCVSSLLAGWAPLFVHAPAKRRWMATMGVGVLIGSAFVNVLPEAIHTTYLQPRSSNSGRSNTAQQHRRLTPTMHPSGVPSMISSGSDAAAPAVISAWNPLSSIAPSGGGGTQSGGNAEEEALHKFKVNRGAPTPTPQAAQASATATRKLAANSNAQHQRHLLAAEETTVATDKTKATKEHSHDSHEGHDHSHAGHAHSHAHTHAEAAPPSRPAPVTSPRLVDDEAAIGSHLHRPTAPAAGSVPASLMFSASSTETGTDSAPAQQLLACFGEDHPSKYMGALLALGFVAMLLVDRCASQENTATAHAIEQRTLRVIERCCMLTLSLVLFSLSGRRSSPLPSVSSDDIESAPMLPATASSRSSQSEGVELMSRQKSSPGMVSPSLNAGGSAGSGNNGAASSSSASASHGTTPRTKVGGGGGSGSGSAHPTPVGSGAAGSGAHLSFPSVHSIASAHSHGGVSGGHSHSPSAGSTLSSLSASPTASNSSASSRSGAAPQGYSIASDLHVLLGVVVYALVDGLSLGAEALGSPPVAASSAAAASADSPLSLLLPRASLSFGVSCFLMFQSRASTKSIQKLALLYAALTPLAAIATWTTLASWPSETGSAAQFDPLAAPLGFGLLGLTKLFAAGALLFTVAVHILPEIQAQHGGGHGAPATVSAAAAAGAVGHGHGGEGTVISPGSASSSSSSSLQVPPGMSVRGSSPSAASRHEEHPLLGVSSSHAGVASQSSTADDGKSMPWRYVVALICGLLTPLALACMHTPKILR